MTGQASDPTDWQQHIRTKRGREELAKRFKDPNDPLKLVIVRDMWLTGFDAPCLHTMYVDKPMSGHNLMQAIARVNRVFKNKPGGLVVDYLGLAAELKKALAQYTKTDRDDTGIPIDQVLEVLMEKYEIVQSILHGFDYSKFFTGKASGRVAVIPEAMDFILQQEDGQSRFVQAVTELSKAYALVATHDDAVKLREEVAFFQCLRAQFAKLGGGGGGGGHDQGRPRRRRSPDHFQVRCIGRSGRHLRRRRHGPPRHFDLVGRVPRRSPRHASAKSRPGSSPQSC